MAKLTKKERERILAIVRSKSLTKEFEAIRKGRTLFLKDKLKDKLPDLDAYLKFVTFANAFANHAPKPFRKMEGNNFKL